MHMNARCSPESTCASAYDAAIRGIACGFMALTCSACITLPPDSVKPVGRVSTGTNFSGAYCFPDIEHGITASMSSADDLHLLPVTSLAPYSSVVVTHVPSETLVLKFRTHVGEKVRSIDLQTTPSTWRDHRLKFNRNIEPTGARLGIGDQWAADWIYRMDDGRLVLESSWSEAGLAFLLFPFYERGVVKLELLPDIDGDCR